MDKPITREQAVDLQTNPNWIALRKEVDKLVESETENLLKCDVSDCVRLQERVKALRFCTRLPELIVKREEKEPEKKIIVGA